MEFEKCVFFNIRLEVGDMSGDSWMYPYQRTPMGNPYISHIVGIYGL